VAGRAAMHGKADAAKGAMKDAKKVDDDRKDCGEDTDDDEEEDDEEDAASHRCCEEEEDRSTDRDATVLLRAEEGEHSPADLAADRGLVDRGTAKNANLAGCAARGECGSAREVQKKTEVDRRDWAIPPDIRRRGDSRAD